MEAATNPSDLRRFTPRVVLDTTLPVGLTLLGFLHRESPTLWFSCLGAAFAARLHHARANTPFGEALTWWDTLCGTRSDRPVTGQASRLDRTA